LGDGVEGAFILEQVSNNLGGSPVNADVSVILTYLTGRQHVHPHASVGDVLRETTDQLGCCPIAIDRALDWLHVDSSIAIGRLRRSEVMQLANAVHRFWTQSTAAV
jgi:hypothetical protein